MGTTTNNDYHTCTVRIVDFEVVRKADSLITLRGKYGVEMTTDEKCLFEDARTVDLGALHCTLADYHWWLAGAWQWHFEQERKRFVDLYADHDILIVMRRALGRILRLEVVNKRRHMPHAPRQSNDTSRLSAC